MKQAMSLTQLAEELERQKTAKADYIADSECVEMLDNAKQIRLVEHAPMGITNYARRQLAEKLQIPFEYFDRMSAKHPDVIARDVNALLQREPARMMVRTLDGNARAFLSDRYRPLDNYDLADAVLPELTKSGAIIESCAVTDTKLYIKGRMPWLDRELPVPEGLKMGVGHTIFVRKIEGAFALQNSEVGAGMIAISPGIFERQCTNLAVFRDEGFGKLHVGKKAASDDPVSVYLSDGTKRLEDAVVWAKVRDVLRAVLEGKAMDAIAAKLLAARGDVITGNPIKVVELFAKRHQLNEGEKGGLLRHLAESGEMSRYGMQWAVTRLSQDVVDYDRSSELERLGGAVIELAANDWKQIAEAA